MLTTLIPPQYKLAATVLGSIAVAVATAAAILLYGASRYDAGHKAGKAEVQGLWDKSTIKQQDTATKALLSKLGETQRRLDEAERIDGEKQKQLQALRSTADAARAAEQRVRQQLARLSTPSGGAGSGDPAVACDRKADQTVRDLYAACLAEYRSLGEEAAADRVGWGSCASRYDSLSTNRKTSAPAQGIMTPERPTDGGPNAQF